ncbi:MAG TPA: transcription antitermination factor NusB [Patescibacteria group bacterium]|nr:transcription antitermination factor NusB [Patescibacteria group bacterium]
MSNRHLARTIAMQSIYQWDFHGRDDARMEEFIAFNQREFAPHFEDGGYVRETVEGILKHRDEIDGLISRFAPNWPMESMASLDRSILRLGTYELKFVEGIPSKVAINEAIELAKGFGGEASGRFVNGVLGAVYKDMVDHGQTKEADEEPQKKQEKNATETEGESVVKIPSATAME